MNVPKNLMYTASHEWVEIDGDKMKIGLTEHAAEQLGDLVFINLPMEGDEVTKETPFCDVESVKAVSDVMSPVSGTVAEVNEELQDAPQMLNESPYDAWIVKVENITDFEELLDADAYQAFIQA